MQLTQLGIGLSFPHRIPASQRVFVIAAFGQSNSIGRAESSRLALTTYPDQPSFVQIYWKPDYTATLNGAREYYSAGTHTIEPDQSASLTLYSHSGIAAHLLSQYSGNPAYVIPCGDGGTALEQNLTSPDWSPASSGECFDIFTQYYFDRAMTEIIGLHPGKVVTVVIVWAQGESDATDGTATADYDTNFATLYAALRAYNGGGYSSYLTAAPWVIPTLNYMQDANEASINADFVAFASGTGLGRVFVVDMSAQLRKVDLSVGQKGGFTPTASDDEHLSYLAQNYLGEQIHSIVKTFYGYGAPDPTEITALAFNPSTITGTGVFLSMLSAKLSVDSNNFITNIVNDLSSGGDFTPAASTSIRKKIDRRHVSIWYSPLTNSRASSASAMGTTLFSNAAGWSFSAMTKPRNGSASVEAIIQDSQDIPQTNDSRMFIGNDGGKAYGYIAIGGTAIQWRTATAVWTTGAQEREVHLAVTCDTLQIRVYKDGVLLSMEGGAFNGNVSALTHTNYVNGANVLQLGANRSAASTYTLHWHGRLRSVTIQPGVVYSTTDIANLMTN